MMFYAECPGQPMCESSRCHVCDAELARQTDAFRQHRIQHDYSCNYCRQTWSGTTAPAALVCPDCGSILVEEEPY